MVAYADIFDYPLTRAECSVFSLFLVKNSVKSIRGITAKKVQGKTYYFLSGREALIAKRLRRAIYAREKWRKATIVAKAIGRIPTVRLVGVTGGLAMNNVTVDDDIDLYCVTEKNTLWITRFFVTILVMLLGVRRTPKATKVKDMFCLNMFTTIDGMNVSYVERDLFSAHEVVQMVPLWEKKGAYKKFLLTNRWVKEYLPNAWKERMKASSIKLQITNKHQVPTIKSKIFGKFVFRYCLEFEIWCLKFLEQPSRLIQLWYMKNSRTNEVVQSCVIRFHPSDARVWIKKKLEKRLQNKNISLDTVFHHQLE